MSEFYGPRDAESTVTIRRPLDFGCNFLDTADTYGPYLNEGLVAVRFASVGRKSYWSPTSASCVARFDDPKCQRQTGLGADRL
jgi:aryl-alcohol dehydrogenase-like predicted oxidoreductase